MNSRIIVICAVALIDMMGYGMVLPLLPFYAKALRASPLEIAATIAAFPLAQLVTSPVLGFLSDRVGRKRLIVAGLFASSAAYLIFGLSRSLSVLVLSRLAAGAAGATFAVAQAFVADLTGRADRTSGMAWLGSAYGAGLMLGPAIGGAFAQFGLNVPGFVASALCFLNAIAASALLPSASKAPSKVVIRGKTKVSHSAELFRRPIIDLIAIYVLSISTFEAIMAVLAIYLTQSIHLTAQQAGILWTVAGFTTIVVRAGITGRLARRFGDPIVVMSGIVVLIAAMLLFTMVNSLPFSMALGATLALGAGLIFPPLAGLTSKAASASNQGGVMGGVQLFGGSGKVLGPLWAGFLFQSVNVRAPFWIAAMLLSCALVLSILVLPPLAKKIEDQKSDGPPTGPQTSIVGTAETTSA